MFLLLLLLFQANVPDVAGVVQRPATGTAVRRAHGHRARGQQTLQIRLPQVVVACGRQSGPSGALSTLHASRLAVYRRTAEEAGRLLRESQTHQQRDGQTRTRKSITGSSSVIVTCLMININKFYCLISTYKPNLLLNECHIYIFNTMQKIKKFVWKSGI